MRAHFITLPAVRHINREMPSLQREYAQLLSRLEYRDTDGSRHSVDSGFVFDGASYPRSKGWRWLRWLLELLLGSPFHPAYIHPTALHDSQCLQRTEPSHVVHARFGRALRARYLQRCALARLQPATPWLVLIRPIWEAVIRARLEILALAVRVGGPRWTLAPLATQSDPALTRFSGGPPMFSLPTLPRGVTLIALIVAIAAVFTDPSTVPFVSSLLGEHAATKLAAAAALIAAIGRAIQEKPVPPVEPPATPPSASSGGAAW